jgi:hypothetical protein
LTISAASLADRELKPT